MFSIDIFLRFSYADQMVEGFVLSSMPWSFDFGSYLQDQ